MSAALPAHDLREGGRWTRAQAVKNALLFVLGRGALAVLGRLPRPWLVRLGEGLGAALHAVLRHEREMARTNLALVFPDAPQAELDALARRTFRALGAHLGDAVDLWGKARLGRTLPLEPGAAEVLAEARASGRGVLFASAHLGPWERVAASLVDAGVPLVTLAREAYDPRFSRVLARMREQHGVRAIPRGGPGAAARIVRTLRSGGVLGAPMDLASRVPTVTARFLGRPARTPIGPARLALRTGCAVVVGTYDPSESIRVTRVPTDDLPPGDAGEQELCERLNDELSRRILAAPEHWPWMSDRFDLGATAGPGRGVPPAIR